MREEKGCIAGTPGANVIKLLIVLIYKCLQLARDPD